MRRKCCTRKKKKLNFIFIFISNTKFIVRVFERWMCVPLLLLFFSKWAILLSENCAL